MFKHMPSQNPGIFRDFAEDLGIEFFEIDLHAGDEIPDTSTFDGLWVMGGTMNVWEVDEYPWLIAEKEAVAYAVVDLGLPYLGVCLGHQLLAEVLGGTISPATNPETGVYDVSPTRAGVGHALLQGVPRPARWVNVHGAEITEPPPGAVVLASSEACAVQVMQYGERAYSCQFHPEVCGHTVEGWMQIPGIPAQMELLPGGRRRFEETIDGVMTDHNAAALRLFENWCALVFG